MGRFLNGVLIGVGVGLLVAPMRGEEMRRLMRQRFEELRGSLPDSEQLNQYAQQGVSTVKSAASNLGDLAQQVQQTGQNIASSTTPKARGTKSGAAATAPFPSAYPEYVNSETNPNP